MVKVFKSNQANFYERQVVTAPKQQGIAFLIEGDSGDFCMVEREVTSSLTNFQQHGSLYAQGEQWRATKLVQEGWDVVKERIGGALEESTPLEVLTLTHKTPNQWLTEAD